MTVNESNGTFTADELRRANNAIDLGYVHVARAEILGNAGGPLDDVWIELKGFQKVAFIGLGRGSTDA